MKRNDPSSIMIRNKKSGQLRPGLTKLKVRDLMLSNLHNAQDKIMSRNINICNVNMLSIFFTENLTQPPNFREVFDSLDKWKMNLQSHYAFAMSNEQVISHRDLILKSAANFLASNCNVEFKITIK